MSNSIDINIKALGQLFDVSGRPLEQIVKDMDSIYDKAKSTAKVLKESNITFAKPSETKKAKEEMEKLVAELKKLNEESKDAAQSTRIFSDAEQDLIARQSKLGAEIAELTKRKQILKKANQEGTEEFVKLDNQLKQARKNYADLQRQVQQQVTVENEQEGAVKRLRAEIALLEREYNSLSEEERTSTEQGRKLTQQLDEKRASLKRAREAVGDYKDSVGDYGKAIQKNRTLLVQLLDKEKDVEAQYGKNSEEHNKVQAEISETVAKLKELIRTQEELEQKMKNLEATPSTPLNKFNKKIGQITAGLTSMGIAAAGIGYALNNLVIQRIKEFELSVKTVQGTASLTNEELETLKKRAIDLSLDKSIGASAKEAADAMNYLALAGYNNNEILAGTPEVLKLAKGAQLEFARASDIATDTASAYGLKASELARVTDTYAKLQSISNTNVEQAGVAYSKVAPVAAGLNETIESTGAFLGVLADNAIKAEVGGTHLKIILQRLSAQTPKAEKALDKLNVSVFDANKNFRGARVVLGDISEAVKNLDDESRSIALKNIFGSDAIASANVLLRNIDKIDDKMTKLAGKDGAAAKLAATMNDTLAGSFKSVGNAWDAFVLSMDSGEGTISKALRSIAGEFENTFIYLKGIEEGKVSFWEALFGDDEEIRKRVMGQKEQLKRLTDEQIKELEKQNEIYQSKAVWVHGDNSEELKKIKENNRLIRQEMLRRAEDEYDAKQADAKRQKELEEKQKTERQKASEEQKKEDEKSARESAERLKKKFEEKQELELAQAKVEWENLNKSEEEKKILRLEFEQGQLKEKIEHYQKIQSITGEDYSHQIKLTQAYYEKLTAIVEKSEQAIKEKRAQKIIDNADAENKKYLEELEASFEKKQELDRAKAEAELEQLNTSEDQKRLKRLEFDRKQLEERKQHIEDMQILTGEDYSHQLSMLKSHLVKLDTEIANTQSSMSTAKDENWLCELFGVSEDKLPLLKEGLESAYGAIAEFFTTVFDEEVRQVEERIALTDNLISEKEREIEAEKRLAEKGKANNLKIKEQELKELKSKRDKEQEELEEAQRKRAQLQTVQQGLSMISAVANVFEVMTPLGPTGHLLAGIAAAAMLGTFMKLKQKSLNLKDGEVDIMGPGTETSDSIPANLSRGESVINAKATRRTKTTLKAINEGANANEILKAFSVDFGHQILNDYNSENLLTASFFAEQAGLLKESNRHLKHLSEIAGEGQTLTAWDGRNMHLITLKDGRIVNDLIIQ